MLPERSNTAELSYESRKEQTMEEKMNKELEDRKRNERLHAYEKALSQMKNGRTRNDEEK